MPLPLCQTHGLEQNVICCEEDCLGMTCHECFKGHHADHNFGVRLNHKSQEALIKWNELLLVRVGEIKASVKVKGSTAFFQMKLDPNYSKGIVNDISASEINESTMERLEEYHRDLERNIEYISNCEKVELLNVPGLLKDLFVLFIYDANRNLSFLLENIQKGLKEAFPHKGIYSFIYFTFNPKELRQLELKRKELTRAAEKDVIVKLVQNNSPYSPSRSLKPDAKQLSSQILKDPAVGKKLLNHVRSPSQPEDSVDSPTRIPAKSTAKDEIIQTIGQAKQKRVSEEVKREEVRHPKSRFQNQQKLKKEQVKSERREETGDRAEMVKEQQQVENKKEVEFSTEALAQISDLPPQSKVEGGQIKTANSEQSSATTVARLQKQFAKMNQSIRELNKLILEEPVESEEQVEVLEKEIKKLIYSKHENTELRTNMEMLIRQRQDDVEKLKGLFTQITHNPNCPSGDLVEALSAEVHRLVEHNNQLQSDFTQSAATLEKTVSAIKEILKQMGQGSVAPGGQVERLMEAVRRLQEDKSKLEGAISEGKQREMLLAEQLKERDTNAPPEKQARTGEQVNEQLLEEVIELEAAINEKNSDIGLLTELVADCSQFIPASRKEEFKQRLGGLKTLQLRGRDE